MPKNKNFKFCPHCGFDVHKSTYYRHKGLHGNDGKWKTGKEINVKKHMCEESDDIYCSHCDTMVSERTFYYHKYLMKGANNIGENDMPESDNKKYCSHCNQMVTLRTYYRHKLLKDESRKNINPISNESQDSTSNTSDIDNINTRDNELIWSENSSGRRKQRIFLDSFVGNEVEDNDSAKDNIISNQLHDMWENISLSDIQNDICSNPNNLDETNTISKKAIDVLHWIVVFISVWACYFNISDNAVCHLLHFLKAIFVICGKSVPILAIVGALFPTTIYFLHKLQGTGKDNFTKFVVCPDCFCTYAYDSCIEIKNGKKQSKKCSFVKHPMHPHRNKRKPCGATLLKEVTLKDGISAFYPRKSYCYRSIISSLQSPIDCPGFEDKCEKWKNRTTIPGTYRDIYDGKVWKRFQVYETDQENPRPFLDLPGHLGLLMNLDWFQPFKDSPYSVGVMYLVVLNLPREERFKVENVILVGIIPGPKEPNGEQMSFFVKPLVDELEQLWFEGMEYKSKNYFAVLLGCACDLPGRKLCGLYSFSSRMGCSKCTKEFNTKNFGEKANYGGFDQWHAKRDYGYIKTQAKKAKKAKTQTEQQSIEKAAGCRWSELMRLPYYDAVEMCIIDPMHALYLGAAKHLLKDIWPEQCNITPDVMHKIQNVVNNSQLPSDVGRIPFKIASNFNSFTSDQFKNWTLYFSLYAMKPYLSKQAYSVWLNFVEACWLFSRPVINIQQISQAHEKLMAFLKGFESWLDSSYTTPNFHMISHLAEQILDYGGFYGYWCYSFERYNGILGNFNTNQRSVELQIMRKFLRCTSLSSLSPPDEYKEELGSLMNFFHKDNGSLLLEIINSISIPTLQVLFGLAEGSIKPLNTGCEYFCSEQLYKTIGTGKLAFVESDSHKHYLHCALEACLGPVAFDKVSGAFMKYPAVEYLGEKYGSIEGLMKRNCHVIVNSWLGLGGGINCNSGEDRPAEIIYFIKVNIQMDGAYRSIVLAYVRWFQKHSAENMYTTDLAKVYAKRIYETEGPAIFVPIQKIKSKFISGFSKVKNEEIRIVLPRPPKIYW